MNPNEVQRMPASIEMDRLIAQKMGWTGIDKAINYNASMGIRYTLQSDGVWKFQPGLAWLLSPSTDIMAVWEVVEKLHDFEINRHHVYWICSFKGNEPVQGKTAPLAICRAALIAWEKDDVP